MGTMEMIEGFLILHANTDFCDRCVAARTGVTIAEAAAGAAVLAATGAFLRDRWCCSECGAEAAVVRALGSRVLASAARLSLPRAA